MPLPPPKPIELAFPLSGVDRSLPARQQLPLTTYELLNVRAFPPSSDRLGGGSREGFAKLFADIAGTADNRRIQGLDVLTEATNITDPNQFGSVALAEDWSTQATADPADLGVNWHPVLTYASAGSVSDVHSGYSINGSNQLLLDSGSSNRFNTILSSYFIDKTVGVSMVIVADRTSGTANDGYAANGQCTNVGPIVASANTGNEGIFACIIATGANTIQCRIYEYSDNTFTQKATSGTLTLDGTATSSNYTIAISVDIDNLVTADFDATGVLTGPADIDETLTYTTALTGKRGGIGAKPRSSGNSANARTCDSVALTQLIPPNNTIFLSIDPDQANPIDGNNYYLPSGMVGVARDNAGVLTVTASGPTSATDPDWPAIDDSANTIIVTNPDFLNADFGELINFAVYTEQSARYGLTLRMDSAQYDAAEDVASPVFRASSDGRNALILQIESSYTSSTGMIRFESIYGTALVDNVATYLGIIRANPSNSDKIAWFHQLGDMRFTDDGSSINIYVNGVLVYSFDPSSFANWTTDIGTALSASIGVGFTGGVDSGASSSSISEFGKVEVVQGEGNEAINVSNVKNKMAVYSVEKVQIGDTNDLTLVDVTGPVLVNPLPSSSSFNRKFYAVDGNDEIIIDPATNISSDWASAVTDGVLPAGVRLCAFFRGSAYLAATDSDPSIWYKSRTLDPLDWDYGADPQVSSAVAGNNGEVGQPGDAITALIPYSDDYLVFGMARSLGVLEGDPGYGGQFQIASNEAGIVGPRAFTFDDRGNLYFVGAGGLYRMFKGTFAPEPVGPRKLRRVLEEIDINSHLIQLAYRPSDRTVRIHITPTDAETVGLHIVYDTRTDGFFFDQYPLDFGPWAIEQINGTLDIDRNIVTGCNDGYVRRPDDDATSDDGTAIASHVEILVPEAELGRAETICQELQFVLGEGGGTITWRWFSGNSPEEVRLMTVGQEMTSGTITGTGFTTPAGLRATGAAHKLRLEASSSTERWSIERVMAEMGIINTRRR